MELKPSYKQTEVGVIPEDWEVKPLIGLTTEIGDGIHTTPKYVKSSEFYFVNGNNLVRDQITIADGTMCVSESEYKALRKNLTDRTLLLSINGTIGNLAFYNRERVVLGKSAAYINVAMGVSRTFISYCLKSRPTSLFFESELTGTTIRNLSLQSLRNTPIPVPTVEEQRAIGAALSDVDALLGALDLLIAKKRNLKQTAMQQLLTGRQRLPGFQAKPGYRQTEVGVIPVDWELEPLGNIFNFSGGFSASRDQLSSEGHCYLHYGDIHSSSRTFIDVRPQYLDIPKLDISLKRISPKSLLNDGDIVFVDASEDDEGTSRHVVVVNKESIAYISGLHTIVAKSKTASLDDRYKRYCFQSRDIKRQFYFYAVGTKVSGISKTNIAKIFLPLPPIPEERAIAAVLSDMDAEITALESRRDKTRALKQGMMQELLTGRVRLV